MFKKNNRNANNMPFNNQMNLDPNQGLDFNNFNGNQGNFNQNGFNNQGNFNPNNFNPNGYNQMGNMNNMNNMPNNRKGKKNRNNQGGKKKGFNKLLLIIPLLLILVIGVVAVIGGRGEDTPEPPVVEQPVVTPEVVEPPVEEQPIEEEPIEEEPEIEVVKYAYENDMLGIKFNYDSNLYVKENVEEIFNTIKTVIPEDREDFNIYTDKLPDILNLMKLTTGDADGLYVSVSILPFEIEQETTTLKIDGTTEVKNENIEALDLSDEDLVTKYDLQIRETLEASECEIITYDKTNIADVGSEFSEDGKAKLRGIYTSRSYSGPVEYTTSTGVVDVIQCTIPVGKNAILVTAVTDGRPIEIDKSIIFNQILESLIVTTEKPVPVEEVEGEVTEGVEVIEEVKVEG